MTDNEKLTTEIKKVVWHPKVKPVLKVYNHLPRKIGAESLPSTFYAAIKKYIQLEGFQKEDCFEVTGPIDKIAFINCPLVDLLSNKPLILNDLVSVDEAVSRAWLSLLHSIVFSVDSGLQLAALLNILKKEMPPRRRKRLFSEMRVSEPTVAQWAGVSRETVQRQARKWRDLKTTSTSHKTLNVSGRVDE